MLRGLRAVDALLGDAAAEGAEAARSASARVPARMSWPQRLVSQLGAAMLIFVATSTALAAVWVGVRELPAVLSAAWPTRAQPTPATAARRDRAQPVRPARPASAPVAVPDPATREPTSPPWPNNAVSPTPDTREATGGQAERPFGVADSREARAEAIFRKANAARRRGELRTALGLYQRLERRFADTRAGRMAVLLQADLLRRRLNEPNAALRAYEHCLATPSLPPSLYEAARVGRAISARQAGLPSRERLAWRELLRHHPDSLHAPTARARLAELGEGRAADE